MPRRCSMRCPRMANATSVTSCRPRPASAPRGEGGQGRYELILSIPQDHGQAMDADQWWLERRLVARKLLDVGDAKTAYQVVRDARCRAKTITATRAIHRTIDRTEVPPRACRRACAFRRSPSGSTTRFARARRYRPRRAAEAISRKDEAHAHYKAAARIPRPLRRMRARKTGYKEDRLASCAGAARSTASPEDRTRDRAALCR